MKILSRILISFQMLVEKGAHVEERDDNGDQPIHSAAKSGCMKSINLLVENNAYICSPGP